MQEVAMRPSSPRCLLLGGLLTLGCTQGRPERQAADATAEVEARRDCDLRARAGGGEYAAAVEVCLKDRYGVAYANRWRRQLDSIERADAESAYQLVLRERAKAAQDARDQVLIDQVYGCWGRIPRWEREASRVDWTRVSDCLQVDFKWTEERAVRAAVALRAETEGGPSFASVITAGRRQ